MMFRDIDPRAHPAFASAWSAGISCLVCRTHYRNTHRPLLGVVAILLRQRRGLDEVSREVLLSAGRVASVVLRHERMQDELFQRAHFDALTNLPNRTLPEDQTKHTIALASRRESSVGFLCIDLDGFKQVNDLHGHHAGDWLLQEVAKRLTKRLRQSDTIARMGGDEFVAIIHDTLDGDGVATVCEAMLASVAEPYMFGSSPLRITASIGASIFPLDATSSTDLRRQSRLQPCIAPKERGKKLLPNILDRTRGRSWFDVRP